MVVCLYAEGSLVDRKILWEELTILKFAFGWSLYVIGDCNETLVQTERSCGFLNSVGKGTFRSFCLFMISWRFLCRVTSILGCKAHL